MPTAIPNKTALSIIIILQLLGSCLGGSMKSFSTLNGLAKSTELQEGRLLGGAHGTLKGPMSGPTNPKTHLNGQPKKQGRNNHLTSSSFKPSKPGTKTHLNSTIKFKII